MPDISPTFATRDPVTNEVTFEFAGKVHAEGLELNLESFTTPTNQIVWVRQSDGFVGVEIGADAPIGADTGALFSLISHESNFATQGASASLDVVADNPVAQRNIVTGLSVAHAQTAPIRRIVGQVWNDAGTINNNFTIMDGLNRSKFLQTSAGNSGLRSTILQGNVAWPGGTTTANFTMNHPLGVTPTKVIVTPNSQAGVGVCTGMSNGANNTQVFGILWTPAFAPPAGTLTPTTVIVCE